MLPPSKPPVMLPTIPLASCPQTPIAIETSNIHYFTIPYPVATYNTYTRPEYLLTEDYTGGTGNHIFVPMETANREPVKDEM